jgi:competence protein ComEA
MKRIWKEYFSFSKKERTAVIILLLLIACFTVLPYVYTSRRQPPVINRSLLAIAEKMARPSTVSAGNNSYIEDAADTKFSSTAVLFSFDPNVLPEEGWLRLGLNPRIIRTILNYRNKGGRFRSAEDLRKIWGLRKEDADRLIPFVRLRDMLEPVNKYILPVTGNTKPATGNKILDINTATAEDWKALPGIGDKLALRIVNYRERLGGFTNPAQVKKT